MFSSPFADDKNNNFGFQSCQAQPQFNNQQQGFVQPQNSQQAQPAQSNDMNMLIQSLRPQAMSNPVRVAEPSYIVTEKQLQQMLALAQGNPNAQLISSQPQALPQNQQFGNQVITPQEYQLMQKQQPQQVVQSESKSWFDELGNITFGTVGRIGHTLTTVADGVIDILTLGYASKK